MREAAGLPEVSPGQRAGGLAISRATTWRRTAPESSRSRSPPAQPAGPGCPHAPPPRSRAPWRLVSPANSGAHWPRQACPFFAAPVRHRCLWHSANSTSHFWKCFLKQLISSQSKVTFSSNFQFFPFTEKEINAEVILAEYKSVFS